jgi:hypothetical protein
MIPRLFILAKGIWEACFPIRFGPHKQTVIFNFPMEWIRNHREGQRENTHFGSLATCALSTSYVCVTYCGSLTAVCVLPLGTGSLFRNCLTSILTRFQAHPLLCSSFAECQQLVYLEINQQNIHESENGPLTRQRF